ncbi:PREDICTED: uncharacterized protein LOC106746193 [Dinoponera quadriceps]|uniref:Uncharacterized protein LOC106746193 n=1 Tax=Dinoponera quadriceps TaxID=609295 RepID=A0A6P3XHN7_DINQU|nr:PREDICTED: uncharacterized protein LOC106746193 [Dinoponera quadriceps]
MILITRPEIKISNKNKLHISRRPGCIAWLLLSLSVVIFIAIFSRLTSNLYFLIILLLGEIMFVLDSFGEWEDLILYKQENKAIVERAIWSDKLCSGYSNEFVSMKLTDIRHVGVSSEMGLFILHKNGKITTFNMRGLTREEIQNLRKEINHFLNMSRLNYLDHSSVDPSNRLLLTSDSEDEYLQKSPRIYPPTSNDLTISDNVLSGGKTCCYRIQQNLSFPTLLHGTQLNSYQSVNLRRGPYTENSMHLDCVEYMRNVCAVPASSNLSELNKECD